MLIILWVVLETSLKEVRNAWGDIIILVVVVRIVPPDFFAPQKGIAQKWARDDVALMEAQLKRENVRIVGTVGVQIGLNGTRFNIAVLLNGVMSIDVWEI
jgi:hypothetical protein